MPNKIPSPEQSTNKILLIHTFLLILAGLAIGVLSKIFDLHNEFLGTMFSEFSIWFLLCITIAIYSACLYLPSLHGMRGKKARLP